MSFLLGRDGKISLFRVGVLVAVLGAVFIVGGFLIFTLEQTTYQSPLNVDPYPGAQDWGTRGISPTARNVAYKIPGKTPDEVAAYYQQKVEEYYNNDTANPNSKCVRVPSQGNALDYRPESTNSVPYYYSCMFERAGFGILQSTRVIIQPGVKNTDPNLNTEGMTVVQYEQQWQP
jgi:hypothetical protein